MSSGNKSSIRLEEILDIIGAERLHEDLKKAVVEADIVVLQASHVQRVTTPCFQLMLAAAKALAAKGGELVIEAPSDAFSAAMGDLGLTKELNINEA